MKNCGGVNYSSEHPTMYSRMPIVQTENASVKCDLFFDNQHNELLVYILVHHSIIDEVDLVLDNHHPNLPYLILHLSQINTAIAQVKLELSSGG